MNELRLYKYIGESNRSFYERGLEYLRVMEELKPDSHMIKYFLEKHPEEKLEDI